MGVGSVIKNNLSGMMGNIERAAILFPEIEDTTIQLNSSSTALKLAESRKRDSNKLTLAMSRLDGKRSERVEKKLGREGALYMVQFNPSTIRFSAVGGGRFALTTYGENPGETGLNFKGLNSRVDMSMTLIMDAVDNKEAFGQDKLLLDPVNAAKAVAATTATIAGKNYSVQQQVEGFHATMRLLPSTPVSFVWGKTILEGALTRANSRYTMFSPTGKPIRAEMDITITCMSDSLRSWFLAYQREFGGKDPILTQKIGQTLSGVLNL